MKKELWTVITVVAMFMGLLIGYSVPPMLEVGLIGEKETVGISTDISNDLEDHYKNLDSGN